MALSAATVWEVQTGGNDLNGGGYVTGSGTTDYSLVAGKRTGADVTDISTTDAVANGTTTITSATANFSAQLVGNIVYFAGGTGTITGVWRQVTARTNATTITIDASIASSTGMTMNIGGALASIGGAGLSAIAGNIIHVKAGAYSITSSSANVSGGKLSKFATDVSVIGYTTTRGDYGATRPVFTVSGAISTFTVIDTGGASTTIVGHIEVDCANKASMRGIQMQTGTAFRCKISNATNSGFFGAGAEAYYCEVTGCSTTGAAFNGATVCWGCVAHDNSVAAFSQANRCCYCIADTNTGASSDGYLTNGSALFLNCVAYANGRDGFRMGSGQATVVNCIAEANVGIGFNAQGSNTMLWLNNAAYTNGTNFAAGSGKNVYNLNPITGTASFFVDGPGGNFAVNSTSGGGASVVGQGALGVYPGATTTGDGTIGAGGGSATPSSSSSGGAAFRLGTRF